MHINIACSATCWGQPIGTVIEFLGCCGKTLFVVIRPIEETGECGAPSLYWDKKDLQVFIGRLGKPKDSELPENRKEIRLGLGQVVKIVLEPVKVLEVQKCEAQPGILPERTLAINTSQGTFYLPDPDVRKEDIPTFNGQPAKYLS